MGSFYAEEIEESEDENKIREKAGLRMSRLLTNDDLDMLLYMLKGDKAALKLALDVIYVGQLWDDLIDRDQEYGPDEINNAFIKAFKEIPNNPFYLNLHPVYQQQLNGLIMSAAMQYRDSTQLEMGDADDRFMAFLIRNAVLSVIHYMIGLVGDEEWLRENGPLFWRQFGLKDLYLEFIQESEAAYATA